MAFLNLLPHPTIQPPNPTLSRATPRPGSTQLLFRRQCSVLSSSTHDPAGPPPLSAPDKPEIELEFVSPKAGEDGAYHVDRARVVSGEKLMRNIMADSKIELYAAYGKIMNCGGGGSCGTCIIEILDGNELLNERTKTEQRYLKQKPDSWRLACQTIVGNKENSGKVVVQRLPQWKK